LEKSLDENSSKLNALSAKQEQLSNEQNSNFKQLGEQLAASDAPPETLGAEYTDVHESEKTMGTVKREIERLETQGTEHGRSAFKKMIGICIAGLILIIGLIWLLFWLFGSKEKNLTPQEKAISEVKKVLPGPLGDMLENVAKNNSGGSSTPGSANTPNDVAEAMKKFSEATGTMKDQADKAYGKKIVVADKNTLASILPSIDGWTMDNPAYRKQGFGQLEGSNLSVNYTGLNNRKIRVNITDAGHATAILTPYTMMFNMNINRDDDRRFERVTTHNDMKVIEKYYKQNKRGSLTFIIKGRYLVGMETTGEDSIEFLKNFMEKFDLSKLQ
jgi:hypothetical protein